MFAICFILLCGALNRVRGGGIGGDLLPGRPLLWVAPAIGVLAWTIHPWPVALAFGAGFAFWGVWSWGYLLAALGGFQPARPPSVLEGVLTKLPGRLLPVFMRMLFVLPCVAAVAWLSGDPEFLVAAPVFAAVSTGFYAAFLRSPDAYDWARSEVATGALWGLMILLPLVLQ